MIHDKALAAEPAVDPLLSGLARNAAALGFEIVEISGFLDEVDQRSGQQVAAVRDVTRAAQELTAASVRMRDGLDSLAKLSAGTGETVASSVELLRSSSRRASDCAATSSTSCRPARP